MRMAMVGFATALGKHGITCNAVAPGMILTDMSKSHWAVPEHAAALKLRVPVGRIGVPEDIGHAVVCLRFRHRRQALDGPIQPRS